jgi:hypothetical protein
LRGIATEEGEHDTPSGRAKVLHLLPRSRPRPKGYNGDVRHVRYYTTKSLNGGITFTCIFCQHSVTTLDFDRAKGNCRTQAASAMNEHVKVLHSSRVPELTPTKFGSY